MKRFWKKLIKEIRLALLRRKYYKADAYESRLFEAYDCGADMIDVLTGGELSRVRLEKQNLAKKFKAIKDAA